MNNTSLSFSDVSNRYFEGLPSPVKYAQPGLFSIVSLLNFHLKKYAFSTLHANTNNTLPLDPLSLISKLVDARAGYCFHHNVAFFEAMRAMDFQNMFFIAGTFPGNDLSTHIAIVWKKEEDDWYLIDPGAGYGISYAIPFDSSKKNPGPYRIRKSEDAHYLEKFSQKTKAYTELYKFIPQPVSLDDDVFKEAVETLTTTKHTFYNNFWYFGLDPANRIWNVILTVNSDGTIQPPLLLIDGKKQEAPTPMAFTLSKTNDIFQAALKGDHFINKDLQRAVIEKIGN